jgi:hypothetical protein
LKGQVVDPVVAGRECKAGKEQRARRVFVLTKKISSIRVGMEQALDALAEDHIALASKLEKRSPRDRVAGFKGFGEDVAQQGYRSCHGCGHIPAFLLMRNWR